MLSIYLGDMDGAIFHPPTYFDNQYEDEWITEALSVEMIKDVDKSDVIGPRFNRQPCFRTDFNERVIWWSEDVDFNGI